MFGPILRGELVSLEPPRPGDSAARVRWFADHEVIRYYTSPGVPLKTGDRASAERVARDTSIVLWRVAMNGEPIGTCFLFAIDWCSRHALSAMVIGERSLWGRGYASEAVRLRTAFAFFELGLERLESWSIDVNVGMHRALERSGYHRFARRAGDYLIEGNPHHEYGFELLREEWLSLPSVQHPGS